MQRVAESPASSVAELSRGELWWGSKVGKTMGKPWENHRKMVI